MAACRTRTKNEKRVDARLYSTSKNPFEKRHAFASTKRTELFSVVDTFSLPKTLLLLL